MVQDSEEVTLPRELVLSKVTQKLLGSCSPVCTPSIPVDAVASSSATATCVSMHCTEVYAFELPFVLPFSICFKSYSF